MILTAAQMLAPASTAATRPIMAGDGGFDIMFAAWEGAEDDRASVIPHAQAEIEAEDEGDPAEGVENAPDRIDDSHEAPPAQAPPFGTALLAIKAGMPSTQDVEAAPQDDAADDSPPPLVLPVVSGEIPQSDDLSVDELRPPAPIRAPIAAAMPSEAGEWPRRRDGEVADPAPSVAMQSVWQPEAGGKVARQAPPIAAAAPVADRWAPLRDRAPLPIVPNTPAEVASRSDDDWLRPVVPAPVAAQRDAVALAVPAIREVPLIPKADVATAIIQPPPTVTATTEAGEPDLPVAGTPSGVVIAAPTAAPAPPVAEPSRVPPLAFWATPDRVPEVGRLPPPLALRATESASLRQGGDVDTPPPAAIPTLFAIARAMPPVPQAAPLPPLQRQLGEAIVSMKSDSAEITLSPEELGRVRIALVREPHGLTVTLSAERPETVELMRRHADLLQRELAGVGHEGARLDFAAGGQGGGHQRGNPPAPRGEVGEVTAVIAVPQAASGRLDLRL